MAISDRQLTKILATASTGDKDELAHAMAREIRALRQERVQLMSTFVPLYGVEDPRMKDFLGKFRDLCMAEKMPAACVLAYPSPNASFGFECYYGGAEAVVQLLRYAQENSSKGTPDADQEKNNSG